MNIEIHTSERSSFRRCPQQWWWKYRMGLVPKEETADALWFGIGIHIALAAWYQKGLKRGPHPADTFNNWCEDEEREIRASLAERDAEWYDEPKYIDARELGIAMLDGYIEEYDRDNDWYVIATEQPFRVNVTYESKTVAVFASTFDGVYRDRADGRIYLMEHKTASQINTAYLVLDDQAGAYWAVASAVLRANGTLKPKENIAGICYNFLRKSLPDDRPVNEEGYSLNKDGSVSKKQPAIRFQREIIERFPGEQQTQMLRLADEAFVMGEMRAGRIPVYKNTTKDCPWCPFFSMCTLHERGNDAWETIMRADYIQQDPYADRRKPA